MATLTGVGEAQAINGPLPVARRYSLLKTPGVVVEEVGEDEGEPRWMAGVNVYGYPAGTPFDWEPCSVGTFRTKETAADEDPQPGDRFDPIAIYFPLECSSFDARDESFIERARLALNATLSHGVEAAIAGGVAQSNNRFLGDTNFVALAGAAVSPAVGLGYLENAGASRTGREFMIHATPAVVAAWGFGSELLNDNSDINEETPEAGIRTRNGTPVVSGSGYIGVHPLGGGGLPGPDDTKDWVFATGPLEVRIGDGPRVTIGESLDRSINLVTVYPERFVVYDWDTALQVGVLIDWSLQ